MITEEQLLRAIKQKSNFDRIMDHYLEVFPDELKPKGLLLKNLIRNYIEKKGYNIKFLNTCQAGFAGVRTKDQVIICSPSGPIGDFIYTLFHEIRHQSQIDEIKMDNPLTEYDLEDFENLYKQYWEMELDADQFAKNMVGKLISHSGIPMDFAKKNFSLSPYIKNYPTMSNYISLSLRSIINTIKDMKSRGEKFEDIQDLPMVKQHLGRLENLL